MDNVKEAFQKVKGDISYLKQEVDSLKETIKETRKGILSLIEIIEKIRLDQEKILNKIQDAKELIPTQTPENNLNQQIIPTDNILFKPLKDENIGISTGNRGVPTNKPTDKQTNQQTDFNKEKPLNSMNNALEILNSLDVLKKEIRLKFKRLTDQEFLVFSTLYQFEEERKEVDYKTLSERLNLSESSIREYVGKLIKKGIPVEKEKINNKTIHLSISPALKKITSLSTILQLREI